MEKMAQKNKAKLLDLLSERLCFERSSVKLYDQVIARMDESQEPMFTKMCDRMQEHRNQEKEHEEWLEGCIRELGGDDKTISEKARLVQEMSKGIEQIVMSDPELPHLCQALLAAELVDNAGWDLLVELADEAGDRATAKEFKKRLREEEEHLALMREAMAKLSAHDVLGKALRMPTAP